MAIDPKQEIRWLLDKMTAAINCPDMAQEARQAAITDFTTQLTTQTRTPALPALETPVPFWDTEGRMWL